MADFRRYVSALALVALLLGAAGMASAQVGLQCTASASAPIQRIEGLTEGAGDIVLNCTGGGAATATGAQIPLYNISVTLNTNITNQVLPEVITVPTGTAALTDAVLVIDAPLNPLQFNASQASFVTPSPAIVGPVTPGTRDFTGASPTTLPNTFLGRATAPATVTFTNIPVEPPGAGTRTIRITNLRGNASALAVGAPMTAFITTTTQTGGQALTVTNNGFAVGVPQLGLLFTARGAGGTSTTTPSVLGSTGISIFTCQGINTSFTGTQTLSPDTSTFTVRFEEQQPTAFKVFAREAAPVSPTIAVSGFPAGVGFPTNGTRLRSVFSNIPTNARLFVTTRDIASGTNPFLAGTPIAARAVLVSADANGANIFGGLAPGVAPAPGSPAGSVIAGVGGVGGSTVAEITAIGGVATATWEIIADDPGLRENIAFGVVAVAPIGTVAGASTVAGTFAPVAPGTNGRVSLATTAPFGSIPRFSDTATAVTAFSFNPCLTNLLFPYVTNREGFNTGLAIVNTSRDPGAAAAAADRAGFSTGSAQSGPCDIYYFGTTTAGATPAKQTSQSVTDGSLLAFTLSGGGNLGITATAGFQGYIIAQCQFRFGHGFAFITDAHSVLPGGFGAMGYLALIMDAPLGTFRSNSVAESFGN